MPQTHLYKQQAGGPMWVHPEQFPGASCMPLSLGDSPRTAEGIRLEWMGGGGGGRGRIVMPTAPEGESNSVRRTGCLPSFSLCLLLPNRGP